MKFSLILFFLCVYVSHSYAAIEVAITVDDLPTHGPLPPGITREAIAKKMTGVLNKHKIPEVYAFINAGKVEEKRESFEVLQIWKDAGHPLGNHTYLHEDLNETSAADFERAISRNEPMLKKLSGAEDWKYFRYPYLREGDSLRKRNAVRDYLKTRGYKIAQVTIDFEDWSWNAPYVRCKGKADDQAINWLEETYLENATDMLVRADIISKRLFKRSIPHILLIHIGAFDAEMLDSLLSAYEKKGVRFIGLSKAIQDPVYSINPGEVSRRGSELTYQIMKSRKLNLKDVGLENYKNYPERKLAEICL